MKIKLILSVLLLLFVTTIVVAQNTVKNPPLTKEFSEDFQFKSFTIYGLNSENEVRGLLNELQTNENLKKVEISSHYQFKGYVKK